MRRRDFITLVGGASAWPTLARAQQGDRARALVNRILLMQAEATAAKISQFIREIESQIGWITQLPWSSRTLDQRRFDAIRLLRQVPAITELSQLDATGKEMMKVSRLASAPVASQADFSQDPEFTVTVVATDPVGHTLLRTLLGIVGAMEKKVYYGPVYFGRQREPYMTLTFTVLGREVGVSVVEVNLKLIQDVVSQAKIGEHGQANVIDAEGRLIFPDITPVHNTNVTEFARSRAARRGGAGSEPVQEAKDILGRDVLTAYAPVASLGWLVFVEMPIEETNVLAQ
jgi:cache domain-containing protein